MVSDITIEKINEVYCFLKIEEVSIRNELRDYFTFKPHNYFFMKKYKSGEWDGNIRLFNINTGTLYIGLIKYLKEFAKNNGYTISDETNITKSKHEYNQLEQWCDDISLPFTPRDYQVQYLQKAINNKRILLESETGSGKSLIIYLIILWIQQHEQKFKCLLIVPTVQLVNQMYDDFQEYSSKNEWNVEDYCHKIYSGKEKITDKPIIISTWQSLNNFPNKYFKQFTTVIVDEAHTAKSKSITNILQNCDNAIYRIGTTGTIEKDCQINQLTLEGLLGPVHKEISIQELIDQDYVSDIKVNCVLLKHSNLIHKVPYSDEIDLLCQCKKRNQIIKNLALELKGNTLILFYKVEKHGIPLYELIANKYEKTFLIHGEIDIKDREDIKEFVKNDNESILLASYGTFQMGINIPNISNIILASPSKSKVRIFQSIGRGLRKHKLKKYLSVYDIGDKFNIDQNNKSKSKQEWNHTYNHLLKRLKYYSEKEFPVKVSKINL